MSIEKAVELGVASNEASKRITGSSEVSAGRTLVAVSTGTAAGAIVGGSMATLAVTTAPITLPLAVGAGIFAGIASLFD
jgi:hypothetical protein